MSARISAALPAGFGLDLQTRAQSSFCKPLFLSEQFAPDGEGAVSPFQGGSFNTDGGVTVRSELLLPGRHLMRALLLSPYAFGAAGVGKGGFAALLGGRVANSGTISVPLGKIALGVGAAATLDLTGDGFLQIVLSSEAGGGDPLINADGALGAARIELRASSAVDAVRNTINIPGALRATGAHQEGGVVVIDGGMGTNGGRSALAAARPACRSDDGRYGPYRCGLADRRLGRGFRRQCHNLVQCRHLLSGQDRRHRPTRRWRQCRSFGPWPVRFRRKRRFAQCRRRGGKPAARSL
jgi:hypothetical protein